MLFNLLGSGTVESDQEENGQSGQNTFASFSGAWPGIQPLGASGLLVEQPSDVANSSPRFDQPTQHPDDPSTLDEYPYGRPPLTPEQTKHAYARMFGLDPATLNADRLEVEHPDDWQPPRPAESNMNGQGGGFSRSASSGEYGTGTSGDGTSFQAQQTAYGGQAPRQDDGGDASTASGPASSGTRQLADNAQSGAPDGGGGSGNNSQPQGDGSKQPSSYSRKLTDKEKYYLRGAGFDDDLLDNMTVHVGKWHPALIWQDAVTPNANEIYMRRAVDKPDSTDLNDLELLAHELHHAVQWRNGMSNWDYVRGGLKHDDNEYEKEAIDRAAQAREAIKQLRLQEIRKEYGANPDGTFGN